MLISGIIVGLAMSGVQGIPWPPMLDADRVALEQFYEATGGTTWKDHAKWKSAQHPCEWSGVRCGTESVDGRDVAVVEGLMLRDNRLTGALPTSVASMRHLHALDVSWNGLSGDVPEDILRRWDADEFDFSGEGNRFGNLLARIVILSSANSLLCGVDEDVRFTVTVSDNGTASMQSVRCAPGSRRTFCNVREGHGPTLMRLSRALKALQFDTFNAEYNDKFSAVTHGTYLTTTAWWGSGSQRAVKTFNRQGPLAVWSAQQMFLGIMSDITWTKSSRSAACADFSSAQPSR
jgi:hypothetical protein